MTDLNQLESTLESFNSRIRGVSRENKNAVARDAYFNRIKAQIEQIRTDLHALGQVLGATNDVVGNIVKDLKTLDKSDKIEAAWRESLAESEGKLQKMIEALAETIPKDPELSLDRMGKEILKSIESIPAPVIPEYPEIKIPKIPKLEIPDIPEPVKMWVFEIKRDGDGRITDVIARADG